MSNTASSTVTRSREPRRILDAAARHRRAKKQLDALEQDNFQEDPHANLSPSKKKLPKFSDSVASGKGTGSSKKRKHADHFKQRFRKTFQHLVEEQRAALEADGTLSSPGNYFTCAAPPSALPPRQFCAVCGHVAPYACVQCGARYCCIRCRDTHVDTRCLKWTV